MKSSKKTFRDHLEESSKPPKTSKDTEDELRGREMAADPMLEYFREKERKKHKKDDKPTYRGYYPPNRYNIRPGHRWDGVDRSNGYEKKLMAKESEKKSKEEQSYRNATRDL